MASFTNTSDSPVGLAFKSNSRSGNSVAHELRRMTHTSNVPIHNGDTFSAPIHDCIVGGRGNKNSMTRNGRAPEAPSRRYESGHNVAHNPNALVHNGDKFSAPIFGSIVGGAENTNNMSDGGRTPEDADIQLERNRFADLEAQLLAQLHAVRTQRAELEPSVRPGATTADQRSGAVTAPPAELEPPVRPGATTANQRSGAVTAPPAYTAFPCYGVDVVPM